MPSFAKLLPAICAFFATSVLYAQPRQEAEWVAKVEPADARTGESAQIIVTATVQKGWHTYSIVPSSGDGPRPTKFSLLSKQGCEQNGEILEPTPIRKLDPNFGVVVGMFEDKVSWAIPIKLDSGVTAVKGSVHVDWMACSDSQCSPPRKSDVEFNYAPQSGPARSERIPPVTTKPVYGSAGTAVAGDQPPTARGAVQGEQNSSDIDRALAGGLLPFLLLSVLAGLTALLTPCVFPMVPITVSYFSKRAENKRAGLAGAAIYSLGIISTFTIVGVLVSLIFGGKAIANFATHPATNIVLTILFVLLALNLFGFYEIRLPSALVNRANAGSQKGGLLGPFAMGLTFTLTSFTCTVGFVGALLAKAAAGGNIAMPVLGMLAFSTVFALPFFLLALFPQYLNRLPKAGSWMVAVKATMGFVELAAALKFFSNADLVLQTNIFPFARYLWVWAAIFVLGGLYLLKVYKFPKSYDEGKSGPIRIAFGLGFVVLGAYCVAAIYGAPTGELGSFLPPKHVLNWEKDYQAALLRSQKEHKPIFINFTGVTCTNCRWMELNMFPRPEIAGEISEHYIPVELFTDRVGDEKNQKLQVQLTGVDTLPIYVIVGPDGKPIRRYEGSTRSPARFQAFLKGDSAIAAR